MAAAGAGNSPNSGSGGAGGRSMKRLLAEMPGLTQLISPPSVPVLSVNPAIGTSPTSLSFTAQQGGGNPAAQTLTISNTGGGTLSWSASDSTTWLSLGSTSGTGTGTVTVSVTTGTFTAGSYSGTVMLSATGASSVIVPVTFTVTTAPLPPAIGASPASFSFTAQAGANPAAQTMTISNTGNGTLSWSASDNAAWLTLSPASGAGNGPVTLAVTTATLTAGSYSGLITLSAPGATTVTVPVTFTVTAAPVPPAIGASPTSLSFTAQQGGGNPTAQTLTISNTGGGTLNWSASDSAAWLTLSPASGTGNGAVTLTATTGTLTAGSHSGTVTLSATGATSVTVPVTFTVAAALTINLSPSSLSYAATQGAANPINQNISLTSSGGTLNWTVSDDASWLTVNPASGSGSSTLTTSVNTAGLAAGTYTGTLTVGAAGASSKTVGVTLTVSAPTTSSATLTWDPNTDSDLAGYKVYRATVSGAYGAALGTVPWAEHPEVPETPIPAWQIWNEQNSESFYGPKPSPKGYAKLLAAASRAIDSRDAGADVVLGGMAELAGSSKAIRGSEYLADLYRVKGAKKSFDAVAPHPYGASLAKVSSQIDLYRKAMKRGGDRGAGMYVTEIGAGSASGGNPLNRGKKGRRTC